MRTFVFDKYYVFNSQLNLFIQIEAMKDQEFYRRLSNSNDDQRVIRLANNNTTDNVTTTTITNENVFDRRSIRLNIRNGHRDIIIAHGNNNNRNNNNPHTTLLNENDSNRGSIASTIRYQQEQQDYLMKGLPFIIVSTSSLVQIANTCRNITSLNLSYTSLLYDSVVAETGEYLSTLQKYAVQPGLTHVQISIKQAIKAIGKECTQLQEVKLQRCEWVTAHVIWMFVYYCPNLTRLDARRSTKCTVKRLIADVLEDTSAIFPSTITPIIPINNHIQNHHLLAPAAATSNNTAGRSDSTSSNSSGNDSSIVLPSSSSSSTADNNNVSNESSNDNAHNRETDNDDEEEEEGEEQNTHHDPNNVTVHFRFNGKFSITRALLCVFN